MKNPTRPPTGKPEEKRYSLAWMEALNTRLLLEAIATFPDRDPKERA
jgi:hypothetical protein